MKKETIINTVILNGPLFYLSACALLGIKADPYEGMGIMYKIYLVSLLFLGVIVWVKGVLKNTNRLGKILPLFVLLIYIIVGAVQGFAEHRLYLQMVCFSVPATCVALNMKGRGELEEMMKIMDLLLPIFAVSFVFMIKDVYLISEETGGAYNQNASYMIAFCFLIDIFLLLNDNNYPKFRFLDNKWYTIFKILLLPYFVVMSFFGGGRGAFVTILVGLVLAYWMSRKKISLKSIIKVGVLGLLSILLVLFVLSKLSADVLDLLNNNFERIAALIDNGSINTSASSGRDDLWAESWILIEEKPIIGYGLFSYLSISNWPHNIFLEALLQGGMVLFFILIVIMILSFSKYRRMLRFDKSQIWLMPLMIYVFTQLLFSGSYMFETYFWFSLSYIYNYRFIKQRRTSMNLMRNSQI